MATSSRRGTVEAGTPHDNRVIVYLGNRDTVEVLEDPTDVATAEREGRAPARIRKSVPGKLCTTIVLAPDLTLMEAAYQITHTTQGVWQAHSNADAPAWVASTDQGLAQLLAIHWGCEVRDPDPDQPGTTGGEA